MICRKLTDQQFELILMDVLVLFIAGSAHVLYDIDLSHSIYS